jgi:hypothetical protein
MADQASTDLQAAQTGKDPITGSILSPETRKLLFKRSQMSASSFLGGGGGSAIVPVNRGGVDSQTLAIVKADQSAIETLKKQVNALVKRDDDFLAQVAQVSSIQQAQINSLTQTVIGLGADFEAVRVSIINDASLEQQKLREENEYEKQLAEQGLREGKEKLLEQKIQNALMAPIAAIGNKVSSIFDKLMNFMWTLLGGWLTMQGLDTLKALATGNKKKLEDIKNNVIKALMVVGGSLLFIQFGLSTLIGSITRLAFKASKFVFSNTIGRLFTGFGNIARGALGKVGNAVKNVGGKLVRGFGKFVGIPKLDEGIKAIGSILKGGKGLAGKILGKAIPLVTIGSAVYRFSKGDTVGGILSILESIPIVNVPAFIVDILRDFGAFQGTPLGTPENKSEEPDTKNPPAATASAPAAKPQNKIIPLKKSSEPEKNVPQTAIIPQAIPAQTSSAPSAAPASTAASKTETPPPAQTSPIQMQSMPKSTENLGQLSEPNAQVVMLNSPQAQSSQKPQSSLRSGSATDIPLFPSSNPDNFYSLYAQVNYNVIL